MAKAEMEVEAVVDWGHLEALVEDPSLNKTWTDKADLGFEQISITKTRLEFLKDRLASPSLKGSKSV